MAISFNFDNSKLPVKEESNKCLNCLRYHKCSENIGRCGCSLDFIISSPTCSRFKDRMRIFKRQLHISFCLYDYNKINNDLKIQDSGLGLIVNYANTDDNILNDIINNEKLMNDVNNKISAYFNKTNPIIVPIISAERYFGDNNQPLSRWKPVCFYLDNIKFIVNKLNEDSEANI